MTIYEIGGTVTGILGVWLAARENKWTWPVSMVSVLLLMYVCYLARLYADVGLNAFYFLTSIYGWYSWSHGKIQNQDLAVSRTNPTQWFRLGLFIILFTSGLGFVLSRYTNADLSYTDSAVTAISLGAYWMQARKKLESWVVWFIVDIGYMGIYIYKNLYSLVGLYFVFLLLCVQGYRNWRQSFRLANTADYAFD